MALTAAGQVAPPRCRALLAGIYSAYCQTAERARFVESWLRLQGRPDAPSVDDTRNLPGAFAELFSASCVATVRALYDEALGAMDGKPFEQCAGFLKALEFVQFAVGVALWKYECDVPSDLAAFARAYDRLDAVEIRQRLHRTAQSGE